MSTTLPFAPFSVTVRVALSMPTTRAETSAALVIEALPGSDLTTVPPVAGCWANAGKPSVAIASADARSVLRMVPPGSVVGKRGPRRTPGQ